MISRGYLKSVFGYFESLPFSIISDKTQIASIADAFPKGTTFNHAWNEFYETLLIRDNEVFNTIDAQVFFNQDILKRNWGFITPRLVANLPGLLVSLGILGTFMGLVSGLSGLNPEADSTELAKGVGILIDGIGTAYYTSIWGILASFLFLIIERILTDKFSNNINHLVESIDKYFQKKTVQDIQLEMLEHQKNLTGTLQSFSTDLSDVVTKAFTETMKNTVVPPITRMAYAFENSRKETMKMQTEGVGSLIDGFMEKMNQALGDRFSELSSSTENVITKNMEFSKHLEPILQSLSKSLESQQIIAQSFNNSFLESKNMNDYMYQNLENMVASMNQLKATIDNLNIANDETRVLQDSHNKFQDRYERNLDRLTQASTGISENFKMQQEAFSGMLNNISGKFDALSSVISDMTTWNGTVREDLKDLTLSLKESASNQTSMIGSYNESVKNIHGAINSLKDIQEVIKSYSEKIASSSITFANATEKQYESAILLSETQNKLIETTNNVKNSIVTMENGWREYANTFKSVNEQLTNNMGRFTKEVKDSVIQNLVAFDEHLSDATKRLGNVVAELVEVIDGLEGALANIKS